MSKVNLSGRISIWKDSLLRRVMESLYYFAFYIGVPLNMCKFVVNSEENLLRGLYTISIFNLYFTFTMKIKH